jgi:2-aminoadipate transaminase
VEELVSVRARGLRSSAIRDLLRLAEDPAVRSLAGGLPAAEGIPVERLRTALERALAVPGRYGPTGLQYGPTEGLAPLRDLVAARLRAQGAPADATDTIITTGSQQGLDLLGRALCDPGDVVVVEDPSYLGARQALSAAGARLHAVTADDGGLRTDVLAEHLAAGLRPKAVYVVANFQNPAGTTLALERRTDLADLADRYGFVVIEDDPYGALRFAGSSLPPVRSLGDRVVTLGTASKLLAPGLRVGWLTAPAALVAPLVRLKQAADLHTATLPQLVVHDCLGDEAWLAGHVAGLRTLYAARADALCGALRLRLGERLAWREPQGGMFVWGRLRADRDADVLLPISLRHGVAFVPGSAFTDDPAGRACLRLSFASLTPPELVDAVERLAESMEDLGDARPAGS